MSEALGRVEGEQSAPGMSTSLPDRRITTGEELGTGCRRVDSISSIPPLDCFCLSHSE